VLILFRGKLSFCLGASFEGPLFLEAKTYIE
jgi:hypothetical protein